METPISDHARAVSIVLSGPFSTASQLQSFALDVEKYGFPVIEPKVLERAKVLLTGVANTPGARVHIAPTPTKPRAKAMSNSLLREDAQTTMLERNPFHVLSATTRDTARRIIELAEERALSIDSDTCSKARADLVTPRTRIAAEIAWLPGLSPQRVKALIGLLRSDVDEIRAAAGAIPDLAHANLVAAVLELLSADTEAEGWCEWLKIFADSVEAIDAEQVLKDINEDRSVSGFPQVRAADLIEAELRERRRYYTACIKNALNGLPSEKLVDVLTAVTNTTTAFGEQHAPLLIDEVVDTYQAEVEVHLQAGADRIKKLIEGARNAAPQGSQAVMQFTSRLEDPLRSWNKLAKPIQISAKARGLDHDLSRNLAYEVRSLCIDLFNKHDMVQLVSDLTKKLEDLFADLPEIAQRLEEDSKAIKEIVVSRAEQRKKDEEWAREITYETDVGLVFKDKLRISPNGVEWKGRNYPLEKITRVRWGGINHSVNGIPSGSTFKIAFGDGFSEELIELKRSEPFQRFIEKLWAAVGPRLMFEMLQQLKAGKRLRFGDGVVDDKGVQVTKHKFLGSEDLYLDWGDVHVWSANGSFVIGAKTDKKAYASMSYIETPNAHVCEAVIRAAFKKGAIPLSRLLGS